MGAKLIHGVNDLQTQFPNVAKYFDETKNKITAADVHAHSNKEYWWFCDEGHTFQMKVLNRIRREKSCPFCSSNKLLVGFNDLATKYPDVANEWDYGMNAPLVPTNFTYGSGYKAWWRCSICGRTYQSNINNRIKGHKCPYCAGNKVKSGENDLQTLFPDLAKEYSKSNERPAKLVAPFSHKDVIWECGSCGHSYLASANHRVHGTGCPFCKQSGGEQRIQRVLDNKGVTYKSQGWFADCRDNKPLRYDFLIYDGDRWCGAIEYNGLQHYKPIAYYSNNDETPEEAFELRERHMFIKTKYALEHGAVILEIPYSVLDIERQVVDFLVNLKLCKE